MEPPVDVSPRKEAEEAEGNKCGGASRLGSTLTSRARARTLKKEDMYTPAAKTLTSLSGWFIAARVRSGSSSRHAVSSRSHRRGAVKHVPSGRENMIRQYAPAALLLISKPPEEREADHESRAEQERPVAQTRQVAMSIAAIEQNCQGVHSASGLTACQRCSTR